jgi:uncharacterized protein (TIGR00661 family)
MNSKKRILVAPLDWGLGHASRCIPIIRQLQQHNFEVLVGSYGRSEQLLKEEFPTLKFIRIEGVQIKYHNRIPLSVSMFLQIPKIIYSIFKEHREIQQIVEDYKIDGIISDNRYGLYLSNTPSVFITHQLQIKTPVLKIFLQKINYYFIEKFTKCWIIDSKEDNLAGTLINPEKLPNNYKYIGTQSRLKWSEEKMKYNIGVILSGPEPQRSNFEKIILSQLEMYNKKAVVILGKTESKEKIRKGETTIINYANSKEINQYILQSEMIICRSGYSSIMDLEKLNKKAILIATPGQTEQEYLANRLSEKRICFSTTQNNFNLNTAISESEKYTGFIKLENMETNWKEVFNIFEE